MYELLYQRLIEDQSDIACCNWIAVEEGEDTCEDDILSFCQSECYQNNGAGFAGWRKNFDFSACNKVYRRNHLCGLRFDETVRFGEDSIFCTQVICRAQSVSKVEVPLYYYLRRLGSLSKTEDVLIYLETIACWDKLCVDHSESFLMVVDIQAALINRASSMLVFPKKYRGMTEEKYRYSCRMLRKHANVASLKGVGSPLRRLQTITAYISPTLARWLGGLLKETGKF